MPWPRRSRRSRPTPPLTSSSWSQQSWIKEDEKLGDPQKIGPCGGHPTGQNEMLLTKAINKETGGSRLHVKIQETVYHSGHYRVALAVNSRNELPPDPMTFEKYTDRGVYSVWAAIQSPPQIPVIADGLFQQLMANVRQPKSRFALNRAEN